MILLTITTLLGILFVFEQVYSTYSFSILQDDTTSIGKYYRDLNDYEDDLLFAIEVSQWIPTGNNSDTLYSKYDDLKYQLGGLNVCNSFCTFTRIYTGLPAHDIIYFDFSLVVNRNWNANDIGIMEFDSYQFIFLYDYNRNSQGNWSVYAHGKILHTNSSLNVTFISNKSSSVEGAIGFRSLNMNFETKTQYDTQPVCAKRTGEPKKTSHCGTCPERHYRHTNGSCIQCDPSCKSCYGPKPSECAQYIDDLISNGIKCPFYSDSRCYNYQECDRIKYFEYSDKTWLGTCDPATTPIRQSYSILSCNNICSVDECFYPDGRCSTQCEYPLTGFVRYNLTFCEYPCQRRLFLYYNGSCINSCNYPLILKNYTYGQVCELRCNSAQIISYDNNTCLASCSFPFVIMTNDYGHYCDFPCKENGTNILYQNGFCLGSCGYPLKLSNYTFGKICELPCNNSKILSNDNTTCVDQCTFPFYNISNEFGYFCGFPCKESETLYQNGSCLSSCGYPMELENKTEGKICRPLCNSNEYFNNVTCSTDCTFPFVKKKNQYGNYCGFKCAANRILYLNGSCLRSCGYPSVQKSYVYGQICEHPCYNTTGILSYYNATCVASCAFPFAKKTNDYGSFCISSSNCTRDQILLFNKICMPSSSCVTPLYRTSYGVFDVCDNSCASSQYIHWNSTCRSSCQYPFHERFQWGLKYCDGPLCGNITCPRCQSASECSADYYCNQFLGGFCMKKVVYLNPDLSKTIINGYVLTAEANPKIEIQADLDDVLQVYLEDLTVDTDYKISIQKAEKGVFKITIILNRPLNINFILVRFKYSPNRLDVRAQLTLPKIVFMPQETLKKGQQVGSASELSFIFLIASLIVFMVLGKMSNMLSFVMINQYLHALLYLNANYLEHTMLYLRSLKNYNAILSLNEEKQEKSFAVTQKLKASLPKRFFEEDYPIKFISNSLQIIGTISITFIVLMLVYVLLRTLKSPPKFLQKIKFSLRWNGILRQIITYSLPLTIASFVQIHVSVFEKDQDIFPLLASLLCLFIFLILFSRMLFIIHRIPYYLSERVLYTDKYGALWRGLNIRGTGRYYYWLSSLRGLLLAYLAIFCDLFPFIQISVLIVFQCGIVSLFLRRFRVCRVMSERDQNMVSLALEIALLIGKGLILANWILSQLFIDENTLIIIGWGIMGVGVFIQIVQAGFSLYMQIKNWRKIWATVKNLCKKSKKRKVRRIHQPERYFHSSIQSNIADIIKKN